MQQGFHFGAVKPLPYFYLVTTVLGLLFTFISPDSSRSTLEDLVFWLSQTLIPLSIILIVHLLLANLTWFNQLTNLWKLSASGLIGVILYLPAALWLDTRFDLQPVEQQGIYLAWEYLEEFLAVGPPILIGWLAMNAPWLLGYRFERQSPTVAPISADHHEIKPASNFVEDKAPESSTNYPAVFPDDLNHIIYLKAELHYLQIVTIHGHSLELFNLRDAISFLSDLEGICPHRSWWVNKQYIERYVPAGRLGKLIMRGNLEVPVSRRKIVETKLLLEKWGVITQKSNRRPSLKKA